MEPRFRKQVRATIKTEAGLVKSCSRYNRTAKPSEDIKRGLRTVTHTHTHIRARARTKRSRKYFRSVTRSDEFTGVTRRFMQNTERQNRALPGGVSICLVSKFFPSWRGWRGDGPATPHPFSLSARARNFLLSAAAVAYEPGRQPRSWYTCGILNVPFKIKWSLTL